MKNILSLIIILGAFAANAQILPEQNLYTRNLMLINPAAAGSSQGLTANVGHKIKWLGFDDAPRNTYFSVDGLANKNMGLGFVVNNQRAGLLNVFNVNLNYAYRLYFGEAHYLAMGVSANFHQNQIRTKGLSDLEMSVLAESDKFNQTLFSSGAGLSYHNKGLGLQLAMPLVYSSQEEKFVQGINALVAYDLMVSDFMRLQPSVFVDYSLNGLYVADANLLIELKQMVWLQTGYRTSKEIMASIGFTVKGIGIGYSYGYSTAPLSHFASGSHEVLISLNSLFRKVQE